MNTQELVQQWKEELRQEGRKEARQTLCDSLRAGLLDTFRARFGTVPAVIESAVQLVRDPDKLAKWIPPFSTKSAEEIADVLSTGKSSNQPRLAAQREPLMTTKERVRQWEQEVRQKWEPGVREEARKKGHKQGRREGRNEGREEGMRKGLLETYRARFDAIPPDVEKAIQLVHEPARLMKWFPLFSTKSATDIAAALSVAGNGSS